MRFLIVDDDESIRLFLRAALEKYAACDCVDTGETGLAAFGEAIESGAHYDVVFMDILMPGMDGHQASLSMRDLEKKSGINGQDQFKLVMVTSLVDDINVSKAFFNANASCYITKPLDEEEVLIELRENLIL